MRWCCRGWQRALEVCAEGLQGGVAFAPVWAGVSGLLFSAGWAGGAGDGPLEASCLRNGAVSIAGRGLLSEAGIVVFWGVSVVVGFGRDFLDGNCRGASVRLRAPPCQRQEDTFRFSTT
jgi:hypothetical protein